MSITGNISNLFGFLGGLGMFLYGMNIMADGMQKTAGGKMSQFLGMLTNNRFMAVCLGALITAIIQSSGATTVMVVGFVSAGVLNLTQAVGVIMGANIGTTITAWIVSLSQLGSAMEIMKPVFYAPLLIGTLHIRVIPAEHPVVITRYRHLVHHIKGQSLIHVHTLLALVSVLLYVNFSKTLARAKKEGSLSDQNSLKDSLLNHILILNIRHQSNMTRSLDRYCKRSLMLCAVSCDPSGKNLTSFRNIFS